MKMFDFADVNLLGGFLFEKQETNRKTTINAVYERFYETGRIGAFDFDYNPERDGEEKRPHIFWDSDVFKWMESAAYILKKHEDPKLLARVEELIEKIEKNQGDDGYFNIYFTVIDKDARFTNRDLHELYCAGHLIEAAVAYAEAGLGERLLKVAERYADYIKDVFMDKVEGVIRPSFESPGHEEIELALIRLYDYTGKRDYLDLAKHFINIRGTEADTGRSEYNQSHVPVREQREAVGHSVRAMYLYTGMAMLAKRTGDEALADACRALFDDTVNKKMYISGGIGSTRIGERFTLPYDLPNDRAYAETCAGIGLIFFASAMLELDGDAKYADVIERVLYNGFLSGISVDGDSFFYENPLEIDFAKRRAEAYRNQVDFPITERVKCFACSCCPPNITRLLSTLEKYAYGISDNTLYVNQFVSSSLCEGGIKCVQSTDYPNGSDIKIKVEGAPRVAIRIPAWCDNLRINKPYTEERGYAVVDNDGDEICVEIDIAPRYVYADSRVRDCEGRVAVMRGPVLYCAEGIDNEGDLRSYVVKKKISASENFSERFGLYTLDVACIRRIPFTCELYSNKPPVTEEATLKMIPYSCFANRGESDMLVWLGAEN